MVVLHLTADEVLTTTRTVRKRLDFSRPVEPDVLRECLEIALQAPSASNTQWWQFVVVTDADQRKAIADIYRKSYVDYQNSFITARKLFTDQHERHRTQQRVMSSIDYLAEHMHEAPALLIPCVTGRPEIMGSNQSTYWGSILPATWSFMLAARERGLGTAWTSIHIVFGYEKDVADILGLPYEQVAQAALIPIAYTIGTDFKPAPREPLDPILHWDRW